VGRSGIREPDYPGTIQYVLRRRDRFGFWTAIFLFAFSAALLTVATVSVATGYTGVAGVWDFLVFGLLMAAGGIFGLRDRAAIVGQVLMAVGDAGIYLTEPPQCIPWPEVAPRSWSAPSPTLVPGRHGGCAAPSCPACGGGFCCGSAQAWLRHGRLGGLPGYHAQQSGARFDRGGERNDVGLPHQGMHVGRL